MFNRLRQEWAGPGRWKILTILLIVACIWAVAVVLYSLAR